MNSLVKRIMERYNPKPIFSTPTESVQFNREDRHLINDIFFQTIKSKTGNLPGTVKTKCK